MRSFLTHRTISFAMIAVLAAGAIAPPSALADKRKRTTPATAPATQPMSSTPKQLIGQVHVRPGVADDLLECRQRRPLHLHIERGHYQFRSNGKQTTDRGMKPGKCEKLSKTYTWPAGKNAGDGWFTMPFEDGSKMEYRRQTG
jgi:hypothetical protein